MLNSIIAKTKTKLKKIFKGLLAGTVAERASSRLRRTNDRSVRVISSDAENASHVSGSYSSKQKYKLDLSSLHEDHEDDENAGIGVRQQCRARSLIIYSLGIIAALLLQLHSSKVSACSCACSGAFGGSSIDGPIMTMPAYTLPKGKFVLSTGINYQNYDEFTISQMKAINRRRIHAHSNSATMQVSANLLYGITDDLSVMISYPFQSNFNSQYTYEGFTYDEDDSIGLGDMSIMLKYQLPKIEKINLHTALVAGLEFPTGFTNEKDKDGYRLSADHQPGSGSWDPLMGIAISKNFKSEKLEDLSLHSNILYKLSNQGSQNTIVGDIVNFNLAANYIIDQEKPNKFQKIFPKEILGQETRWSLVSEVNSMWQEKVTYDGIKDDAHGGLLINWMNGVKLAIEDKIILGFLAGFPLINDLNGVRPEAGFNLIGTVGFIF